MENSPQRHTKVNCLVENVPQCAFLLPSFSLSSKNSNVLVRRENFCLHNKILKNDIFFNILIKNEINVLIDLIIMKQTSKSTKKKRFLQFLQKFDCIHPLILPPNLILAPSVASCLKLDLQIV